MILSAFTPQSKYTKRAKFIAIVWTLLILFACFIPGNEIPDVSIPLIDKWVHFILFGGFSFLWLCAYPSRKITRLLSWLFISIFFGWLVEFLQGQLSFLGRSQDNMDTLADGIGGLLGIVLFYILAGMAAKHKA